MASLSTVFFGPVIYCNVLIDVYLCSPLSATRSLPGSTGSQAPASKPVAACVRPASRSLWLETSYNSTWASIHRPRAKHRSSACRVTTVLVSDKTVTSIFVVCHVNSGGERPAACASRSPRLPFITVHGGRARAHGVVIPAGRDLSPGLEESDVGDCFNIHCQQGCHNSKSSDTQDPGSAALRKRALEEEAAATDNSRTSARF
ncbi:unnamed protein product [Pleuronectes platessa]|uniref:Uncharacterized protein n=1 Tax=Pleuronectes platessa TaxID=8262 RepID=A0A9N7W4B3_PLEPL|nr:unnamed protein product [Pleuronectes platessa]